MAIDKFVENQEIWCTLFRIHLCETKTSQRNYADQQRSPVLYIRNPLDLLSSAYVKAIYIEVVMPLN